MAVVTVNTALHRGNIALGEAFHCKTAKSAAAKPNVEKPADLRARGQRLSFTVREASGCTASDLAALGAAGFRTGFQAPDWCAAWQKTQKIDDPRTVFSVLGHTAHGQLAFVLPLMVHNGKLGPIVVALNQFNNAFNAPAWHGDLLCTLSSAEKADLIGVIAQAAPHAHSLSFHAQPFSWAGQVNPLTTLQTATSMVVNHVVTLAPTWDEFTQGLAKTVRRDLRKKTRLWTELKTAQLVRHVDPAAKSAAVRKLLCAKTQQVTQHGSYCSFEERAQVAFYTAWARSDECFVYELQVNGEMIAGGFGMCGAKTRRVGPCLGGNGPADNGHSLAPAPECWHLMSVAMAPAASDYAKQSPGLFVMQQIMRDAIAAGAQAMDLGPGNGQHKKIWRPVPVGLFESHHALRPVGVPIVAIKNMRSNLRAAAKRSTVLQAVWRRLRSPALERWL
ncbi:MAG: GNAT family N-acetyltransferase [Pseudomonadota bacterium]